MTVEEKYLDERMLRTLLRKGRMKEGVLAAFCQRRLFEQSWRDSVDRLVAASLVSATMTGHGNSRVLRLTDAGTEAASKAKAELSEKIAQEIIDGKEEEGR